MPTYLYRCPKGHISQRVREVGLRRAPVACDVCQAEAELQFTARFQLITQPQKLADENKFAFGHSEADRRAQMKADDEAYEKSWAGAVSAEHVTVSEAISRTPLNSIFPHS